MNDEMLSPFEATSQALDDIIEQLDAVEVPHDIHECRICAAIMAGARKARDHGITNGETGEELRKHGASQRQVALQWAIAIDWASEALLFCSEVLQAHLAE